ncbi:hypothetical protein Zmor_017095 [Zophobas morio]|uniref:C2H2-type domain-containing protein n=1 Tax=Zophobas morio TaxID=2755281 RepID=A0AA38I8A8_9CUCU|nr:hypothetical protein Zmor_017095 [Zophobas morio]
MLRTQDSGDKKSFSSHLHYCNICPFYTTSRLFFANHIKDHGSSSTYFNCENSTIENYHCKDCDFETHLTLLLKQHREKYHSDKTDLSTKSVIVRYVCEKCGLGTHFLMNWLQHTSWKENAAKTKNSKCDYYHCKQYVLRSTIKDNKKSLITHECVEHKNPELRHKWEHNYSKNSSETEVEVLPTKSEVKKITSQVEEIIKQVKCGECSCVLENMEALRNHVNKEHKVHKKVKWYQCGECMQKLSSLGGLQKHMKEMHPERKVDWYKCEQCAYRAKYATALRNHVFSTHSNDAQREWYQCKNCTFKSNEWSSLQIHMEDVHLHDVCYKCEECMYTTSNPYAFRKHITLNHISGGQMKWYQCGECTFSKKRKGTLRCCTFQGKKMSRKEITH